MVVPVFITEDNGSSNWRVDEDTTIGFPLRRDFRGLSAEDRPTLLQTFKLKSFQKERKKLRENLNSFCLSTQPIIEIVEPIDLGNYFTV